jgi:glycosyltransferase involved in cell wall biosynthesis
MRRTRLLILVSSHHVGGLEAKLHEIVRGLDKKLFRLSIIQVYPEYKARRMPESVRLENKSRLVWDQAEVVEIPMRHRFDFLMPLRIANVIRSLRPDVLVFFALGSGTFLGPVSGMLAGVSVLVRMQETIMDGLYPRPLRWLDRMLCGFIDRILVPSEFLKTHLNRELRVFAERIGVVPNAVDMDRFAKSRWNSGVKKELDIPDGAKVVGMIANLSAVKAHEVLLNAVPDILKEIPETIFLLIGEGSRKDELIRLTGDLGILNAVRFLGFRGDTEQIIPLFDAGVNTSRIETHGIALIEMMAAGVPVVAPNVGGIPEIIRHGENGWLVPQGDSDALAAALIRILTDKDLTDRLSRAARNDTVNRFSLDYMIQLLSNELVRVANHG